MDGIGPPVLVLVVCSCSQHRLSYKQPMKASFCFWANKRNAVVGAIDLDSSDIRVGLF
jgi:hypothetical protein